MPNRKKSGVNPDVIKTERYYQNKPWASKDKPDEKAPAADVTAYTMGGKEVAPDAPDALAKSVLDPNSGQPRYYIKAATSGMDAGHLFNPQSPTFTPEELKRVDVAMGKGRFDYRKVSKEAFDSYVLFLQSGSMSHYRNADRNIL